MATILTKILDTLRDRGPVELSKRAYRRSISARSLVSVKTMWYRLQGYPSVDDATELTTLPTSVLTHRINTDWIETSFPKEYSIQGGNWDRHAKPFETDPKYQYIRRYHEDGAADDRAAIFPEWDKPVEHRKGYEQLYETIREHGYRTQNELTDGGDLFDEINVCFGRDGTGIVKHGHHRVSIAKVLGIPEVQVYVRARHQEWQQLRDETWQTDSFEDLSTAARQHVGHPDMAAAVSFDSSQASPDDTHDTEIDTKST